MTKMLCKICGGKTTRIQPLVGIPICKNCWTSKEIKEKYKYINQTTAISEYGLTKKELDKLPFFEKPNPHYKTASPMKLFLLKDIEEYVVINRINKSSQ